MTCPAKVEELELINNNYTIFTVGEKSIVIGGCDNPLNELESRLWNACFNMEEYRISDCGWGFYGVVDAVAWEELLYESYDLDGVGVYPG